MGLRLALLCDASGRVSSVTAGPILRGELLTDAIRPSGRVAEFLDAVRREGAASGWLFDLPSGDPRPVRISGVATQEGLWLIGEDAPSAAGATPAPGTNPQALQEGAFAAIVAHDLRAPLRNIRQFVALFEDRARPTLDDRMQLWLDHIVANVERMQRLIDDSLALARGQGEPRFAPVNLNDVVDGIAGSNVTRDDLPVVLGMRSQIEVLFQNLFENCAAHAPDAHVHVTARPIGSRWMIAVQDDGPGIALELQPRIFDLFVRGEGEGGSGIGLATCRDVVQRHHGDICVESGPCQGCGIYFSLPALTS